MGIGVVDDSEFNNELERLNGRKEEVVIVEKEKLGRGDGNIAVPDSVQKIIGETSVIEGRQEALRLAKFFGVSDSSVSAYANGASSTSSYHTPKPDLKNHIDKRRNYVIGKARKTMLSAINNITEEKLVAEKATNLSAVARDMSVIIKNMEPKSESLDDGPMNTPFVIFAPTFRDERSFEVINVQDEKL